MSVKPIPDGFHSVTPFLVIYKIKECIEFMKKAFDAKEVYKMEGPDGVIMHAEVKIGNSMIMMGEASEKYPPLHGALYLYVEDVDKTYQNAINAGATSNMAPADQFYGDRTSGVNDPFGNKWWIGTHIEDVSPEEMKKREEEMRKKQN